MSAYLQMKDMLTPTTVYNLDGTTLIDYELYAYAKVIDLISDMLSEVKAEALFETGTSVAKEKYLALFGDNYISTGNTDADLYALMAGELGSGSISDIDDLLSGFSFTCDLEEEYDEHKVVLRFDSDGVNYTDSQKLEMISQVMKKIEEYIPAHILVTSDITGTTWNDIEAYNKTFDQWETLKLSWNIFNN